MRLITQDIFKLTGNMIAVVACLFLSILLQSCEVEDQPLVIDHDKYVVTLSLLSSSVSTRAGETEGATEYEKFIDYTDLFIGLYEDDGELNRIIFDSAGLTVGGPTEMDDDYKFKTEFTEEEISRNYKLIVLANFGPYFTETTAKPDVSSLNVLRVSNYAYPSSGIEAEMYLPMIGEKTLSSRDIIGASTSSNNIYISIERIFAKIEIDDNLADKGASIKNATLSSTMGEGRIFPLEYADLVKAAFKNITNLEFTKGEDCFYLYLPQSVLGSADSDSRKVNMVIETSSGDRDQMFYIRPYGADWEERIKEEKWQSLLPNNVYRFRINDFGTSEPEITIPDEIYITWVDLPSEYLYAGRNKFDDKRNYLNFLREYTEELNPYTVFRDNVETKRYERLKYTESETNYEPSRIYKLDLKGNNLDYNKVYYQTLNSAEYLEPRLCSPLAADVMHITTDNGNMYFWLNSPYCREFPLGKKCRIFWRDKTIATKVKFKFSPESDGTVRIDSRGYQYVEFNLLQDFKLSIDYEIMMPNGTSIEGAFDYRCLFPVPYEDPEYYAFYLN